MDGRRERTHGWERVRGEAEVEPRRTTKVRQGGRGLDHFAQALEMVFADGLQAKE